MYIISSKRTKGAGKGNKMGFPTINVEIAELPSGMEIGLYAGNVEFTTTKYANHKYKVSYKCLSLVSKYGKGFRIETHALSINRLNGVMVSSPLTIDISVGQDVSLILLDKLRDPIKTKDVESMINNDVALTVKFFDEFKTCENCQLCYFQDTGYSNYTVEGTTIGCYADKFEEVEQDSSNYVLYNAIGCQNFVDGESWSLDVDHDSDRPTKGWLESVIRDTKLIKILDEN